MSREEMKCSVVIACHNDAHVLGDQLEALARQQWTGGWEVIVVDDGSSDDSAQRARSFAPRFAHQQVILLPERRGSSVARNEGARKSQADLLLFLDADDVVAPGYVHAMAEALGKANLVCSRLELKTLNSPEVVASRGESWQWDAPIDEFGYLPHGAGGSLGVRRTAFDTVGGFSPGLGVYEDVDFCWRVQLAGHGPMMLVPDAILHYRLRSRPVAIAHQAWSYGRSQALIRKRYALHDPQQSAASDRWRGRREVAKQEFGFVRIKTRGQRLRLLWVLGVRAGISAQTLGLYFTDLAERIGM